MPADYDYICPQSEVNKLMSDAAYSKQEIVCSLFFSFLNGTLTKWLSALNLALTTLYHPFEKEKNLKFFYPHCA